MNATTTGMDRLDALLRKQEQERSDIVAELLDEERRAAASILGDLHPDAGAALVDALAGVERQIRADHRADRLLAKVETAVPTWADRAFAQVDPDDPDAGRRRVVLFVPRRYADGHIDHVAVALIDVSDVIFGRGSGRQRDQRLADDRVVEAGRDAEIARDREREAARR